MWAIVAGAHILRGVVYGNRMVNLRVSNNKLFHRAVGIVSQVCFRFSFFSFFVAHTIVL